MNRYQEDSLGRLVALAAITGLRTTFGPALLATARRSEERGPAALAAAAELMADKIPGVPSRDTLGGLVPRAMAGYWVGRQVAGPASRGGGSPWAAPLAMAVAVGVGWMAPKARKALGRATGLPDPVLGLVEDVAALAVGAWAAGLSGTDVRDAADTAIEDIGGDRFQGLIEPLRRRMAGLS